MRTILLRKNSSLGILDPAPERRRIWFIFDGMKILIAGAGGLIGTNLAKKFCTNHEVLSFTHDRLDITNEGAIKAVVEREQPNLIINCAVVGVDECEVNPAKAQAINVDGPANLARATAAINAEMVHFSTNYVFDGERESGFYTIDDEPRPINIYGQTKLEGELAVAAECERSFIVRTSWVFGPGKNNFYSDVHRQLMRGETVYADGEIWASATYVNDLAVRVESIIERRYYGDYHVVNSGICSKLDFARAAAECVGVDPFQLIQTTERATDVPRPRYTPMRCKLSDELGLDPMRNWKEALRDYIEL